MEAMREAWTDERLDDLNERVGDLGRRMDDGFNRVHEDLRSLRNEVGAVRKELDSKIDGLRIEIRGEIAALHRLMLQMGGGIIATIVATQIAGRL
jgi:hypothetical protein